MQSHISSEVDAGNNSPNLVQDAVNRHTMLAGKALLARTSLGPQCDCVTPPIGAQRVQTNYPGLERWLVSRMETYDMCYSCIAMMSLHEGFWSCKDHLIVKEQQCGRSNSFFCPLHGGSNPIHSSNSKKALIIITKQDVHQILRSYLSSGRYDFELVWIPLIGIKYFPQILLYNPAFMRFYEHVALKTCSDLKSQQKSCVIIDV